MAKDIDVNKIITKIRLLTPDLVNRYYDQTKFLVALNAFKAFIDLETAMTDYDNTHQIGVTTGADIFYSGNLQQIQIEMASQLIRLALKPVNLISADITNLLENMQDYISTRYQQTLTLFS